jgi:hypothetical protein
MGSVALSPFRNPHSAFRIRSGGSFQLVHCGRLAARTARLDEGQALDEDDVVIRGDPVIALVPARMAAMDNRLFTFGPGEDADGRHRAAAGARAVAGPVPIHVTGIETERAVVAVLSAGRQHPYKRPTMAAAELLAAQS